MSLVDQINTALKEAMKAKEKEKLEALRAIKSAILLAQTEKGGDAAIDEATELKMLQKLVKQRDESAKLYREKGRDEMAESEEFQASVIREFLPEMMSDEEIKEILTSIIAETGAQTVREMGKVMGVAAHRLAGKADNSKVAELLRSLLNG